MVANLMLPLLLLILAGGVANRVLQVEAKPLAKLTLYLLSPALVFNSLYHSQLTGDQVIKLGVGTLLVVILLSFVLSALSRVCNFSQGLTSGMQLGSVFMNIGNYGLPIISAVCGPAGLERAAVVMVVNQMLMFTLAIYFAARSSLGVGLALRKILQMPTAYAAALAFSLRYLAWSLPSWLLQSIALLCQASIPIFLLLLGIQLADMLFCRRWLLLGLGTFFKLALSPCLAVICASLLRLDSVSQQVLILAAASPTAVITTMLSVEFDTEPELVSSLTLLTTIASLVSIPIILRRLGLG